MIGNLRKKKNETDEEFYIRASKAYYSNGYHIDEIAKKLKIDIIIVYNAIVPTKKRITTESERQEMIALRNKGYSYSSIANIFHRSRSCVKDRINSPAKVHSINSKSLTDAQVKKMNTMINDGCYISTISKELGISRNNISVRLGHEGKHKFKKVTNGELQQYIKMYNDGKTHAEIAKKFSRHITTVGRNLRKNGYWRSKDK